MWEKHGGKQPKGKILIKDRISDSMFQQVLLRPDEYSMIATTNLNGDYMSDALAAQVGGLGLAPGSNEGDGIAVFEATHGTAPKYAGQDKVNPSSVILSGVMMFRWLGWKEAAENVERALSRTISQKRVTYDLERQMQGATLLKASEFGQAIVDNLRASPARRAPLPRAPSPRRSGEGEDPRVSSQGNPAPLRRPDAAGPRHRRRARGGRHLRRARRALRGQGADPCRRARQGRRREARRLARGSAVARQRDPGHEAAHAADRARGPGGAQGPDRGGARHRPRALRRDHARPPAGEADRDGVGGRRHGHRRGGGARSQGDPAPGVRSAPRPAAVPGARGGRRPRPRGQDRAPGGLAARGAGQGLPRDRRHAGRDQPADDHQVRRRDRARRQDELRRQRALPARRHRRHARPRRGEPARGRGRQAQPQLHQARRLDRLHGERRRAGDGDHGHHQALRRRAGQLPRRRRRRQSGSGGERVPHPGLGSLGRGGPHQHLRRHRPHRPHRARRGGGAARARGRASCRWWCGSKAPTSKRAAACCASPSSSSSSPSRWPTPPRRRWRP